MTNPTQTFTPYIPPLSGPNGEEPTAEALASWTAQWTAWQREQAERDAAREAILRANPTPPLFWVPPAA